MHDRWEVKLVLLETKGPFLKPILSLLSEGLDLNASPSGHEFSYQSLGSSVLILAGLRVPPIRNQTSWSNYKAKRLPLTSQNHQHLPSARLVLKTQSHCSFPLWQPLQSCPCTNKWSIKYCSAYQPQVLRQLRVIPHTLFSEEGWKENQCSGHSES